MDINQINNPTIKDFEKIIPILNDIFSKFPDHKTYSPEESFKRMHTSHDTKVFIAEINDKIIGFTICYERYPGFYHIWQLGVIEEFRKQGIGTSLYKEIENYAQVTGYKGVTLNTFNKYSDSLQLALKRGYEIYGLESGGEYKHNPKINLRFKFG